MSAINSLKGYYLVGHRPLKGSTQLNRNTRFEQLIERLFILGFMFLRYTLSAYLTLLDKISYLVVVGTTCMVACLRTAHSVQFTLGMYVCGLSAKLLQTQIKQSRPVASVKKSYGMPSAHSATVAYITWYALLTSWSSGSYSVLCLEALRGILDSLVGDRNECCRRDWLEMTVSVASMLVTWGPAICVCWSRHYFRYHTSNQILAGVVFGLFFSTSWFKLWNHVRTAASAMDQAPSLINTCAKKDSEKINHFSVPYNQLGLDFGSGSEKVDSLSRG